MLLMVSESVPRAEVRLHSLHVRARVAAVNESTNTGFWSTKAANFDFAKYADDLRNHREWTGFLSDTTLSRSVDPAKTGSSTELIFQHTYGTYVFIYRTSGSIFVPCSMFGWTSTSARQYDPAAWPATRGAPNLQMWLWTDKDGDGSMHATEFKDLTDNNVSATWRSMGLSVDSAGGIWHRAATGDNCINATTEVPALLYNIYAIFVCKYLCIYRIYIIRSR